MGSEGSAGLRQLRSLWEPSQESCDIIYLLLKLHYFALTSLIIGPHTCVLPHRIVKEQPVKRTLNIMPSTSFLSILEEAQEQYKKDGTLPGGLNETEFFWITQRNEVCVCVWGGGAAQA